MRSFFIVIVATLLIIGGLVGIRLGYDVRDSIHMQGGSFVNNYNEGGQDYYVAQSPPDSQNCENILHEGNPLVQTTEERYCENGQKACEALGKECVAMVYKRTPSFFWKNSKFSCLETNLLRLNYKAICA